MDIIHWISVYKINIIPGTDTKHNSNEIKAIEDDIIDRDNIDKEETPYKRSVCTGISVKGPPSIWRKSMYRQECFNSETNSKQGWIDNQVEDLI